MINEPNAIVPASKKRKESPNAKPKCATQTPYMAWKVGSIDDIDMYYVAKYLKYGEYSVIDKKKHKEVETKLEGMDEATRKKYADKYEAFEKQAAADKKKNDEAVKAWEEANPEHAKKVKTGPTKPNQTTQTHIKTHLKRNKQAQEVCLAGDKKGKEVIRKLRSTLEELLDELSEINTDVVQGLVDVFSGVKNDDESTA